MTIAKVPSLGPPKRLRYSSCRKSWRETFLNACLPRRIHGEGGSGLQIVKERATAILCFIRPIGRTAKLVDEKVVFPTKTFGNSNITDRDRNSVYT